MKLLLFTLFSSRFAMYMRPLLFFFLIVAGACNITDPVDPVSPTDETPSPETPGTGNNDRVKENKLVMITSSDGFYPGYSLIYDSIGRLKTINSSYIVSSYHVYWKNDTIDHVINTRTATGATTTLSNIFLYNANKQCYKILSKTRNNWDHGQDAIAETNPFFSDPFDGQYEKFDSLVYSPSGQLIEIWAGDKYGRSRTLSLLYADAQSVAPSNMQLFGSSQADESGVLLHDLALACSNTDQPLFKALWFLPFLKPAESTTPPLYAPTTPQTTSGFFICICPLSKSVLENGHLLT